MRVPCMKCGTVYKVPMPTDRVLDQVDGTCPNCGQVQFMTNAFAPYERARMAREARAAEGGRDT